MARRAARAPKIAVRTDGPPGVEFAARATLRLFVAFADGRARCKAQRQFQQKEKPPPDGIR
jgi:hypothetical protein